MINICCSLPLYIIASSADPRGEGGGCTLIFSYIRKLGPFLEVKFLSFNIFLSFQKNEYFFGYENFVDIFGVIPKLD